VLHYAIMMLLPTVLQGIVCWNLEAGGDVVVTCNWQLAIVASQAINDTFFFFYSRFAGILAYTVQ
jgi:hypothetical protein